MIQIIRFSLMVCEGTIPDHNTYLLQDGMCMGTSGPNTMAHEIQIQGTCPIVSKVLQQPLPGVSIFAPITS